MLVIKNDLLNEVSEFLINCAEEAINEHGAFLIGVSGGSMASFLGSLGNFADFSKWHIFMVDERAVALSDADCNCRAIRAAWRGSAAACFHPINETLVEDLKELAADYENQIRTVFARFGVDKFDCLLLGLGPDGHTASLFPEHPDFLENLRNERLVIPVSNAPKPPPNRISLSPVAIENAVNSAFIVTNSASKAPVISAIIDDKNRQYPPTVVAPEAHWFLDEISSSHLKNKISFI
jgi:6-phosphogluconolactonase